MQDALHVRTAAQQVRRAVLFDLGNNGRTCLGRLLQMGPSASGLWTAPSPAPTSDSRTAYDVSLPPWDTNFSSADVADQRSAGAQLLQDLSDAVTGNASKYASNSDRCLHNGLSCVLLTFTRWTGDLPLQLYHQPRHLPHQLASGDRQHRELYSAGCRRRTHR